MSELLNLSNELLRNDELLDVEGHIKPKTSSQTAEDGEEDEVEAHKTRPKTRPKYRP